jgi:hypothetical protein
MPEMSRLQIYETVLMAAPTICERAINGKPASFGIGTRENDGLFLLAVPESIWLKIRDLVDELCPGVRRTEHDLEQREDSGSDG